MLEIIANKIQFRLRYSYKNLSSNIFTIYKNWYILPFDFLFFLKNKKVVYHLKDSTSYIARINRLDTTVINEIRIFRIYDLLLAKLKPKATILDIGAHIGVFSIYAARQIKNSSIFAYEPLDENYDLLYSNIEINKLNKRVHPYKLGVAKKNEKRFLFISHNNSGGHSLYSTNKEKVTIETISLQQVFQKNKIKQCDLLKMDCEGSEYEILFSTPSKYLKKIKNIAMEYHANGNILRLKKHLEENGFLVSIPRSVFPLLFATRK